MGGSYAEAGAALLRRVSSRSVLGGRLELVVWELDIDADGFDQIMAAVVARSYLPNTAALKHPQASLASKVPPKSKPTVRRGDFAEILASLLYSARVGDDVPFRKLEHKSVAGATVQGPDVLGLSLDHAEDSRPAVVEVKFRTTLKQKDVLLELRDSLAGASEDYLVSAWAAAAELLETHPNAAKVFALSAALHLGRLNDPQAPLPDHDRQAVVVIPSGKFTEAQLEEHWGTSPPVSHLHVITVPDAPDVVDRIFDAAAKLSYSDAASGVPGLIEGHTHVPGLAAPVSSTDATSHVELAKSDDLAAVIEAALWLLADWDGMGVARARQLADRTDSPVAEGLARLLVGARQAAEDCLTGHPELLSLVKAVRRAWDLELTSTELTDAAKELAEPLDGEVAGAVRYVAAAIAHRLSRHPGTITGAAGATGPNVAHVVKRMVQLGHAFWPSQAKALGAGLLDAGQGSMAVKMPTSAGKSRLIELATAHALDTDPNGVVVVLGPSKALVSQLSRGMRDTLLKTTDIRSSSGGLDFDLDDVTANLLASPGVAVMTPERFDLEWRRTLTGDDPTQLDALGLLIIDEAHLIYETRRGARLELIIARALRRGIRVLLLSSQFPDATEIGDWVGGKSVESSWSPTWLRRFVYFTDAAEMAGMLQAETGDPAQRLTLLKDIKANRDLAPEPGVALVGRPSEAAALAQTLVEDGLVVLFTNVKARAKKLLESVAARAERTDPVDPALEELAASLDAAHADEAELLRKRVGIHHADVPRAVRLAVETAARKGLLQYLVCTSTLLEGVDFPASSVIAVYPPQDNQGRAQVARLRNLAGRAGRAGRFTYGTLVVMTKARGQVAKWLRAFRAQLPATATALAEAMHRARTLAEELDLLERDEDTKDANVPVLPTLDAVLVAAVVEGSVIDGDLRAQLEEALGRTLWWTKTDATYRDGTLAAAERRARTLNSFIGADKWRASFYRTGLPVASSVKLRDVVHDRIDELVAALDGSADGTELLVWLAATVAPAANELARWQDLDATKVADALRKWINGEPVETLEQAYPDTWNVLEDDLETFLPWVLTAAIEYIATEADRPDLRDRAHGLLGVPRVRYGVPHVDLCDLVRRGQDRVAVAEYAAEYDPASSPFGQTLEEYVAARLAAAAAEEAAAADDSDEPEVDAET